MKEKQGLGSGPLQHLAGRGFNRKVEKGWVEQWKKNRKVWESRSSRRNSVLRRRGSSSESDALRIYRWICIVEAIGLPPSEELCYLLADVIYLSVPSSKSGNLKLGQFCTPEGHLVLSEGTLYCQNYKGVCAASVGWRRPGQGCR